MSVLFSPVTGQPLRPDGAHILVDADGRRWPVLDGIPYLRVGRDDLVGDAAERIAAGDLDGARVVLLADQDDWWTGARPDPAALRELLARRDALSLREAMTLLAYDRVGDYFAHRWSDPTFLSGLAHLEAHWRPAESAFELACGIGHYLRELARRGTRVTGIDVVFSKLWLARRWVVGPAATFVCCDATANWPIRDTFDLVFCHDALYFLAPQDEIVARLRAARAPSGRLMVGHVHNSDADNFSKGHAVTGAAMAELFPNGLFYDDAEMTRALVDARAPRPQPLDAMTKVEAFGCEDAPARPARDLTSGLALPPPDASLRLNPLYRPGADGLRIDWPSPRYAAEYGPHATYPMHLPAAPTPAHDGEAARRRVLVDLPERW